MIITKNEKVLLTLTDMMYQRSHTEQECANMIAFLGEERTVNVVDEELDQIDIKPFDICRNREDKRRMLIAVMIACGVRGEKDIKPEILHRNNDLITALYHYTKELKPDYITNNPFISKLSLQPGSDSIFTFSNHKINAYVPFTYGSQKQYKGMEVQPVAYFNGAFRYPVIMKDGKTLFSMNGQTFLDYDVLIRPVSKDVLICGLKAGYLAYMFQRKQSVTSITVVEHDAEVIRLFKEQILPQFENPDKIHIIQDDAYDYLQSHEKDYNWIINDLYQNFHDNIDALISMKAIENAYPHTRFLYWEEGNMLDHIRAALLADMAASLAKDYEKALEQIVTDEKSKEFILLIHQLFEDYRIDKVKDYTDLYDDKKLQKIVKEQSLQYVKRYNKI